MFLLCIYSFFGGGVLGGGPRGNLFLLVLLLSLLFG